jgi:hypothetical protein
LTDEGLAAIASIQSLEELDIFANPEDNHLTGVGFASHSGLQNLEKLQIHDANLTDEGLAAIASIQGVTSLKIYFHDIGRITARGWESLPRNVRDLSLFVYGSSDEEKRATIASNALGSVPGKGAGKVVPRLGGLGPKQLTPNFKLGSKYPPLTPREVGPVIGFIRYAEGPLYSFEVVLLVVE